MRLPLQCSSARSRSIGLFLRRMPGEQAVAHAMGIETRLHGLAQVLPRTALRGEIRVDRLGLPQVKRHDSVDIGSRYDRRVLGHLFRRRALGERGDHCLKGDTGVRHTDDPVGVNV
jgi:hypothetical protein